MFFRSVFALAVLTVACSKEGSDVALDAAPEAPARTGSCDRVPAMSVCSEYSGGYLAQNEAVLTSGCAKLAGTFVAAQCPNTAVLGTCVLSTSEVRKFYASGGAAYDAPRARKECEGSYRGKWSVLE
jgi:hypothetical protein